MAMQKHKCQCDFGRIKSGPSFVKLSGSLNLEHEISSIDILHDKEQTILNTKPMHTRNIGCPKCTHTQLHTHTPHMYQNWIKIKTTGSTIDNRIKDLSNTLLFSMHCQLLKPSNSFHLSIYSSMLS